MAPTQEQKRIVRIVCKEQRKLQQRETKKSDQLRKLDGQTQAAVHAIKEQASHHRKLVNKYYSVGRQCIKEKENVSKLCDKKKNKRKTDTFTHYYC